MSRWTIWCQKIETVIVDVQKELVHQRDAMLAELSRCIAAGCSPVCKHSI